VAIVARDSLLRNPNSHAKHAKLAKVRLRKVASA